jgi:TRAP transporter 4TM/12TM fusion protein
LYPATKKSMPKVMVLDWVWMFLAAASGVYILINWERIALNAGIVSSTDIFFGVIAVLVVLESARRSIGPVLAAMSTLFLAYAIFGYLIPGTLGHREYSISRIIAFLYTGTEGIYGTAIDVSAKYVALFVLFGFMLEFFGGGQLFVDIAYSLTGKLRGGPAKASVVSSALMGTMSGSAVANVVTTGAFTIPLMKKNGYKPHVAGAVEAVASTGGQIMPPLWVPPPS